MCRMVLVLPCVVYRGKEGWAGKMAIVASLSLDHLSSERFEWRCLFRT